MSVEGGAVELIDFIYGDATGDRLVNGVDVVRLLKYISNLDYDTGTSTVEINPGADANRYGEIIICVDFNSEYLNLFNFKCHLGH